MQDFPRVMLYIAPIGKFHFMYERMQIYEMKLFQAQNAFQWKEIVYDQQYHR